MPEPQRRLLQVVDSELLRHQYWIHGLLSERR
jgi:hypothetical protein